MNEPIHLKLSVPELNLILEALGGQPYYKVYELIARLQTQAQEQLQSAPANNQLKPAMQPTNGAAKTSEPANL